MIKIAFPLIGRGGWTGGYAYLKNMLRVISTRLPDQVDPYVILTAEEGARFGDELRSIIAPDHVIIDPRLAGFGTHKNNVRVLLTGKDKALFAVLKDHNIEVMFESANFYGARFGLPVIAWIPDFQHCHMPEMFSPLNRLRRNIGFRAEIAAGRTMMVSSQTACDDLERFFPSAKGKGHVVPFAIEQDIASHLERGADVIAKYNLPNRFFFLPNQFWRHKNHTVLVDALIKIKAEGKLEGLPPIILSGHNKDPRNPDHFQDIMDKVKQQGLGSHFKHLGLIPYEDVLALVGAADRLINPSLFEGWSTPIEEAKALGAPMVLSNLLIHQEQASDALFFDPYSGEDAAKILLQAMAEDKQTKPSLETLVKQQNKRLDDYAARLLHVIKTAIQ